MAYKIPYVGSERKQKIVFKAPVKAPLSERQKISCVPNYLPPLPEVKKDLRPIEIPRMTESLRKILLEVAEEKNVHPNDIVGVTRSAKVVAARRDFVWRARNETNASFPRIGEALNRDHTTALYHYQYKLAWINNEEPKARKRSYVRELAKLDAQTELSDRQIKVRSLILRGFKNAEIAVELGVSMSLIKHDKRAIKKLHPIPEKFVPLPIYRQPKPRNIKL